MKSATKHWTLQRLSALALIPLTYWLLAFLHACLQGNFFETSQWLNAPLNKSALLLWLLITCYHAAFGLQVVVEDYVSNLDKRKMAIWSVYTLFSGVTTIAIIILF